MGNYQSDADGGIVIFVSQMENEKFEHLVSIHELVESILCHHRGIKNEDIDQFDIQFEKDRKAGLHSEVSEPGDDTRSPYHDEHQVATTIERLLAVAIGVDWKEYERAVSELSISH